MPSIDGLFVGFVSLVVGALAIHVAAGLVGSGSRDFGNALVTAAVGAVVYALFGYLGGIPLVGPLLLLLLWVGVVNWRYPDGWVNAAAIGAVAWLTAMVVLALLATVGIVEFSALGVPGV